MKNGKRTVYPQLVLERLTRKDCLCYLFLIFLLGCFAGWCYEEIFYWVTEGMLRNRGVLYGPWLPIYGIGTLGIYAMKPLKRNPALLFLVCVVMTGVVEYVIGYMNIRFLGVRLWDYRGLFLNLDGIICLRSVLSFAVMGLLFLYLLEPTMEWIVNRIKPDVLYRILVGLLFLFTADCILSALFRTPITY